MNLPLRIISLVPSQTELLFSLGLDEQVIGITKFCVHPNAWFRSKQRVGGTKTLNIELIKSMQPDLVIANKEENVKAQVEEIAKEFPVWVSNVNNVEEAYNMIFDIGRLTGREIKANNIIEQARDQFSKIGSRGKKRNAVYLLWKDPYMVAGGDTFIHDMMEHAGLCNVFGNLLRYPIITIEDLQASEAELILLSSEPYPFKQQHVDEIIKSFKSAVPKVICVDGEMFSWYGSRMIAAAEYLRELRFDN